MYPVQGSHVNFLSQASYDAAVHARFDIKLRHFYKRWPRFYYFMATVFGPALFVGMSPRTFIKSFSSPGSLGLNLGSGPRSLGEHIINVDIGDYKEVDIRADCIAVPLRDNSVDFIICEELVEHVPEAGRLIAEVHRMLKPGGHAYFAVPFLYPYHASPHDYTRWTRDGFLSLLHRFSVVASGIRAGAFSALAAYCCYLFALVLSFNSKKLFWLFMNASIFIFFPIKFLDIFFYRAPMAFTAASVFYYVVRKNA